MAESKAVYDLLQNRIPEARQQLRDSHKNLGDLATYCERNYIDSGQTQTALEETKRYAAQSLASVAYQVNVLAVGMLELLDQQMKHLGDMEANIHHISQARDLVSLRVHCKKDRSGLGALGDVSDLYRLVYLQWPLTTHTTHVTLLGCVWYIGQASDTHVCDEETYQTAQH